MGAAVGDRIEMQRPSVHMPARGGIAESVLSESPGRYGVRWDDGRWSIISATDGSLRVLPRAKPRRRRAAATSA
jgi:Domain of unknown function (DUF1918)